MRVLEVPGGVASGYATKMLAGYGAEVNVLHGLSDLPQLTDNEVIYLGAGKRHVHGDLYELARDAQIVVEEGTPGRIDVARLRADRADLVVTSISPFGQTGPYARYQSTNAVSFAAGGIMSLTGDFHREPLVTGGSHAQYFGGLHAFAATLTAYYGAVLQGEGDWIDVSLQECAAATNELYAPMAACIGVVTPRMGNQTRAEWGLYPCADGYAGVFALQRQIPALFSVMDDPELATDPQWLDPAYRAANNEELTAKLFVFMATHTMEELLKIGREHQVPIGVALTPGDLLDAASLAERGYWDTVVVDGEPVRIPGRVLNGLGWKAP